MEQNAKTIMLEKAKEQLKQRQLPANTSLRLTQAVQSHLRLATNDLHSRYQTVLQDQEKLKLDQLKLKETISQTTDQLNEVLSKANDLITKIEAIDTDDGKLHV